VTHLTEHTTWLKTESFTRLPAAAAKNLL
jgi:hypothetical protein